jgi:hypothetical protein
MSSPSFQRRIRKTHRRRGLQWMICFIACDPAGRFRRTFEGFLVVSAPRFTCPSLIQRPNGVPANRKSSASVQTPKTTAFEEAADNVSHQATSRQFLAARYAPGDTEAASPALDHHAEFCPILRTTQVFGKQAIYERRIKAH